MLFFVVFYSEEELQLEYMWGAFLFFPLVMASSKYEGKVVRKRKAGTNKLMPNITFLLTDTT